MRAAEYLLVNFCGTRAAKLFPFSMLIGWVSQIILEIFWC
jgi:hypothetical protein